MKEIWKDIPGYEGLYQASNLGNIRSLPRNATKGKLLSFSKSKNGYYHIILSKNNNQKTFNVHRLIMLTFYGKSNLQIDHIDGNKQNNNLNNLEYVTNSENMKRAYKNGLLKFKKNKINQYDMDMNYIKTWYNAGKIEKELNINHSNIIKCCRNKRNNAGGFIWKYEQ